MGYAFPNNLFPHSRGDVMENEREDIEKRNIMEIEWRCKTVDMLQDIPMSGMYSVELIRVRKNWT